MRHCAVMEGNSLAGIIEAATLGTPVVNVGDRKRLRECNAGVVDVTPDFGDISVALLAALSRSRGPCENIYGDGRASERIVQHLTCLSVDPFLIEKYNAY